MFSRTRVTIRDVAARAGVSHQTVSRVINGYDRVSTETQARVEAAIAELGYQPNAIARFMARGRSHTLACFSPNLTDYTFAGIIEGAEMQARQRGYFLISASAPDSATFTTLVSELVDSRRIEGLLVINPFIDDRHAHLPGTFPVVYIGAQSRTETADSVCLDDRMIARTATHYLLIVGHRHIAHITGPLVEDCARDRQQGYRDALQTAGLECNPQLEAEGDWSASSGYEITQRFLDQGLIFTALFTQNDRMAIGAMRAIRQAGQRIPEDVSVIGCDDIPLAAYFDPPLTTMRQDLTRHGQEAARLLIRRIENPGCPPEHLQLPAQLILRQSVLPYERR